MRDTIRLRVARRHGYYLLIAFLTLTVSTYIEQVTSMPADTDNQWPTFPRRNIAALARGGYLKNGASSYKRSVSVLAKNGLLPTYRSPYGDADKHDQDEEEIQEKRNIASIARLRSYSAMKRNIQALARDGFRVGRGQYNQPNDKRNIAALARNGLIHKKDDNSGEEYYYPFYQNPIPPLSEIDGPFDINEMYDFQQSVNPDMFPPLSQVYKRSAFAPLQSEYDYQRGNVDNNWYFKRGAMGMPVHGLYRPMYAEPTTRTKRYILSLPDVLETNDIHDENENNENEDKRSVDEEARDNFEKRHIGSLARLGLLPSFRFTSGRYSRSGRARLLLPSQEMYRKHSADENLGIRKYISSPETDTTVDSDYSDIPPPAVPPHSHPTGRILNRPLSNDIPSIPGPPMASSPPLPLPHFIDSLNKNRWQSNAKDSQKFYYFRSLKVPYHTSGKRYLLLPAVDNILLRKTYRNSSLPSRRKNQ